MKIFLNLRAIFIFLLAFRFAASSAQSSFLDNKKLILSVHNGFVLKNKAASGHLANQRPTGIEVELNRQTKGEAAWNALYHYPETGISLQYWIMDPQKKLGNLLGLVFYIQKALIHTKKSKLEYRVGAGFGYVEKRFNLYRNNQDNLISSRFNFVLNGRLLYSYRVAPRLSLTAGIGIVHFSNGGLKMPNQGINIPSINIGTAYHFREKVPEKSVGAPPFHRKWVFMAYAALASKNEYPVGSKNFLAGTVSLYAGRSLNRKSTLLIGIDYFYDGSMKVFADSSKAQNRWNFTKSAFVFGHELAFGKLSLITHIGYIFFQPIHPLSSVFQRYGVRYYFTPKIAASLALNAHLGKADFVEWGITYRFMK